jgi:hypothetical protein
VDLAKKGKNGIVKLHTSCAGVHTSILKRDNIELAFVPATHVHIAGLAPPQAASAAPEQAYNPRCPGIGRSTQLGYVGGSRCEHCNGFWCV